VAGEVGGGGGKGHAAYGVLSGASKAAGMVTSTRPAAVDVDSIDGGIFVGEWGSGEQHCRLEGRCTPSRGKGTGVGE